MAQPFDRLAAGLLLVAMALAAATLVSLYDPRLVFVMARRLAGSLIGAIAAITWLLHSIALMTVLALYAEPIFIAFMVASYFALVAAAKEQRWSARWLVIAGAAAACSILMRYSGVLWPAAAGLWLLLVAVRGRSWQPIRAAFIFGALPALTTAALFLRNFLLTDRFSGGQFEYGGAGGVAVAIRHLLWDWNMVLGKTLRLSPIIFTIVIGTLILAIAFAARRSRRGEARMQRSASRSAASSCWSHSWSSMRSNRRSSSSTIATGCLRCRSWSFC